MENNATDYSDSSQRLLKLMRDTLGSSITMYYLGTPSMIAEAALPCLIVQKVSGSVVIDATGTDLVTEKITILVLKSSKDELGAPDDNTDTTMRALLLMIEGRDATTGFFRSGTILDALRKNITLSEAVINSNVDIDYDVIPRKDEPAIFNATITLNITERVIVANRT